MAQKNDCTPQSIYGGFEHTLFLGLTVLDFSANAGWNEQFSTLTVRLAEDPCAGTRKYFDNSFNWVENNLSSDPGFNNAPVGSAALFKVADFEFAGLIQSYNQTKDAQGNPILVVNLISPGAILEGAQVILDGYQGSVNGMPNIVNVYGFLESLIQDCPQIGGFGSPSGGFGNARRTDRGIAWSLVKPALQVLLGGVASSVYSPFGGLVFKQGVGTYGSIASDYYIVDIDQLPDTTGIDYRIPGPNASLLELISNVCRDGGYEFYVDFLPTKGGVGVITNIIKIRTISRRNQPALGSIQSFITSQNAGSAGEIVTQNSIGQELRSENNSAFIVGGQKRQVYQQTNTSYITPFWGYNGDGNLNASTFTSGEWVVNLDVRTLNLSLHTSFSSSSIDIKESEMLGAMGDIESFKNYILNFHSGTDLHNYIANTISFKPSKIIPLGGSVEASGHPADAIGMSTPSKPIDSTDTKDLQTLHNWLNSYLSEFYGKKWLAAIPWVCYDTDVDTGQVIWSDLPSTEGGWFESSNLLGLTFPSTATDFFSDEQGKVQALMKYPGGSGINVEELSDEDFITNGTDIWIKANLDDKWVVKNFGGTDYACALLTLSNPPVLNTGGSEHSENYINLVPNRRSFFSIDLSAVVDSPDKSDAVGVGGAPFASPVAAALPILSNTQTYGPWLATANAKGNVYFEKDDGLNPWEYGGTAYMSAAANAKIVNSITEAQVTERGSVTVAGYPTKALGRSIDDTPSLIATRIIQVGSYSSNNYYYITDTVETSAAQITNISVTVNPQSITTKYDISSFTPVLGRFSKNNAERLKQIGQQRIKMEKQFRSLSNLKSKLASGARRGRYRTRGDALRSNSPEAHRSSAMYFMGKMLSNQRKVVNAPTMSMTAYYADYDTTSIMTMDGLLRPVKKQSSSADLAQEVSPGSPTQNTQPNYTEAPAPPINQFTNLVVNTDYLDFLANPESSLPTNYSNTPNSGHDIEGVARSNKAALESTTGLFPIQKAIEKGGVGYENDYRYLALRGPLVIHGWGYDVMGKPVPNSDTDDAGSIDTSYNNKTNEFKDGWLQDSKTWPVAPVDLRYDRKRGVWTVPPGFRILKVIGNPISAGNNGVVNVLNADDVFDTDGATISSKTINLVNFTAIDTPDNKPFMAYYDNVAGEYWPIFPGSGGSGEEGGTGQIFYGQNFDCVPNDAVLAQELQDEVVELGQGLYMTTGAGGNVTLKSLVVKYGAQTFTGVKEAGTIALSVDECELEISGGGQKFFGQQFGCQPDVPELCIGETVEDDVIVLDEGLYMITGDNGDITMKSLVLKSGDNIITGVERAGNVHLTVDGCVLNISGSGEQLCVNNTSGDCDIDSTEFSDFETCKIIFGSGLRATNDGDSIVTVDADPKTIIDGSTYSNIILDGNLGLTADGCDATISGYTIVQNVQGPCDIVSPFSSLNVERIVFGTGLDAYFENEQGVPSVKVNQQPLVSFVNTSATYSGIRVLGNIDMHTAAQNSCVAEISGYTLVSSQNGRCDVGTEYGGVKATGLNFGTGLDVSFNNGRATINSNPLVQITGSQTNNHIYSGIKVTGNIETTDDSQNSCIVVVSGYTLVDNIQGICAIGSPYEDFKASKLIFDTGITVDQQSDGSALVKNDNLIRVINFEDQHPNNLYSGVKFTGNLVTTEDGCIAIVSGSGDMKFSNVAGQCDDALSFTEQPAQKVIFGTGLDSYIAGDTLYVNQNPLISDSETNTTYSGVKGTGGITLLADPNDSCVLAISGVGLKVSNSGNVCDDTANFSDTSANHLVFGTGLNAYDNGNNQIVINQNPLVKFYNNNAFYSGLNITGTLELTTNVSDSCVANISGFTLVDNVKSKCDYGSNFSDFKANKIIFGTGLAAYTNNGSVYVDQVPMVKFVSGSNVVTGIDLHGNLDLITDTDCVNGISGYTLIDSIQGICSPEDSVLDYKANKLIFGTGITVNVGGGEATIQSIPLVRVNNFEDQHPDNLYSGIKFTGSLTTTEEGCEVIVSGNSALVTSNTVGTCEIGSPFDSVSTTGIVFGTGLNAYENGDGITYVNQEPLTAFADNGSVYSGLKGGGAISLLTDPTDSCIGLISGDKSIAVQNEIGYSPEACDLSTPFAYTDVTGISFNTGLDAYLDNGLVTVRARPVIHVKNLSDVFSGINLTGNLEASIHDNDACIVDISGFTPVKNEIGDCDISVPFDYTNVTGMIFSTGLEANIQSDGNVKLSSRPKIRIANTESTYTGIKFTGNLSVQTDQTDDCLAIVSGEEGGGSSCFLITDFDCDGTPPTSISKAPGQPCASGLAFGAGLKATTFDGDYLDIPYVELDLQIRQGGTVYCDDKLGNMDFSGPFNGYSGIVFGPGFGLMQSGCDVYVQSALSVSNTGTCGDDVSYVDSISVGCGIKTTHIGPTCTNGATKVRSVRLELDPNCGDPGTTVEVLTCLQYEKDIDGHVTDIKVSTTDLNFSSCGLFIDATAALDCADMNCACDSKGKSL